LIDCRIQEFKQNAQPSLATLALAATVSPRHNGDVRILTTVVHKLATKSKLLTTLHDLNNQATRMKENVQPIPESFKTKYAETIVSLEDIEKALKPELLKLRRSQEVRDIVPNFMLITLKDPNKIVKGIPISISAKKICHEECKANQLLNTNL